MITGIRTHISIGGLEIMRTPHVWIECERHSPLSRAGITLADPKGEYYRSVGLNYPVRIRIGYRDEEPAVWKGSVSRKEPGTKDQIEIRAVGQDLALTTNIIQSWANETPEAIIGWAVGQAGLPTGQIDSPGVTFPWFTARNIPVWQVARQCAHTCQRAFGLDMSRWALWMGASGKVNWGDFDEPGDVPVIASGAGLIKHMPANGTGALLSMVETFLLAGFRHSRKFRLIDNRRGIDDEFRALRVRHDITDRAVRTFIWYGEEHEKY